MLVHFEADHAWAVCNRGHVVVVSLEDAPLLEAYQWTASKTNKRCRKIYVFRRERGRTIYIHRQIMGEPEGIVDHRDGDSLNNRRGNLRAATQGNNCFNLVKRATKTSSKYKGVYWDKCLKRWRAYIQANGKKIYCGIFHDEDEAARAYNAAAAKLHGDFARLNQC